MLQATNRPKVIGVIVCIALLLTITPSAFAAEPHENPELAKPVFSGISLFRYYTNSLDFVLRKDPGRVKTRLEKMPFANILPSLEQPAANITAAGIEISYAVVTIDNNIGIVKDLIRQSRFKEAAGLAAVTFSSLSQAYIELDSLKGAAVTTGDEINVLEALEWSSMRQSYDNLLNMIDRIKQLLDLYNKLLLSLFMSSGTSDNVTSPEQSAKLAEQMTALIEKLKDTGISQDILQEMQAIIEALRKGSLSAEQSAELDQQIAAIIEKLKDTSVSQELLDILMAGQLRPTEITFEIDPTVAFVGDSVSFGGLLTSEGKPMAGRNVDILLDNSYAVTIVTNNYGQFHGILQIPYWYIPEIDIQALYYPQEKDTGVYLAALSQVVKLNVLFYEARIEVTLDDKAYPGLETTVTGRFDYGQHPPLDERRVEIYLDNVPVSGVNQQKTFTNKIRINPETEAGQHNFTVSATPAGRYAPVSAEAVLNVTKATPILDINLPKLALIPGSIGLTGKLRSTLGPLDKASITMGLGNSQVGNAISQDGTFQTKIGVGLSLGLIGTQDLLIQVIPSEPWNANLVTTRSLLMVNWVNFGGILIIFIFIGLYLPRRLQRRFGVYWNKRERPVVVITEPEITPVYSQSVTATPVPTEEKGEIHLEPRDRIFNWYRLIARALQSVTKALLGPQKTLREFARESATMLGPVAKYFEELTTMVERLLYSRYAPVEEDAENSRQLAYRITEGETRLPVITLPMRDRHLSGDGTEEQVEPTEIPVVDKARGRQVGGGVSLTIPGRQSYAWLWVMLALSITYYACILLFILPWLVILFARR